LWDCWTNIDWRRIEYRNPSTIEDARYLMRECEMLHEYNLHIAVVHDDDRIEHVAIGGERAEPSPCANDLRLVFPLRTGHFFPALTYEQALPVANGRSLCGRCFTQHELGKDKCPPSILPCPLCKAKECHNTRRQARDKEEPIECSKCGLISIIAECAAYHERVCKFTICRYCDTPFNNIDIDKRLHHYILNCNVSKCHGCYGLFRSVCARARKRHLIISSQLQVRAHKLHGAVERRDATTLNNLQHRILPARCHAGRGGRLSEVRA